MQAEAQRLAETWLHETPAPARVSPVTTNRKRGETGISYCWRRASLQQRRQLAIGPIGRLLLFPSLS